VTTGTVSREELQALLAQKGSCTLVDVREPNELTEHGALPTAHNLPLSELPKSLTLAPNEFFRKYGFLLDSDETYVVYCRSGARSARAATALQAAGFTTRNFSGGVLSWSEIDSNVRAY
jgi:adenylyltransferase/sulfurtransferase